MFTIAEFNALSEKVRQLEKGIDKKLNRETEKLNKQLARNTALSAKVEGFRSDLRVANRQIDRLEAKEQRKVKPAVEMLLDGVLKLTEYEIADRLFVDVAYINNMKSIIRRERK